MQENKRSTYLTLKNFLNLLSFLSNISSFILWSNLFPFHSKLCFNFNPTSILLWFLFNPLLSKLILFAFSLYFRIFRLSAHIFSFYSTYFKLFLVFISFHSFTKKKCNKLFLLMLLLCAKIFSVKQNRGKSVKNKQLSISFNVFVLFYEFFPFICLFVYVIMGIWCKI